MDKTQCNDKSGKNHYGEYGFQDGYTGSLTSCRLGLSTRESACQDADACASECLKNTKTNVISQNIRNMKNGEKLRAKEIEEDKAIEVAKREEEKKKAEEAKRLAELDAMGLAECSGCKKKVKKEDGDCEECKAKVKAEEEKKPEETKKEEVKEEVPTKEKEESGKPEDKDTAGVVKESSDPDKSKQEENPENAGK